ncbi:hypothetical protein LJY23_09975, partial [Bifidobacterium bifidum]|nr:hypothetical protein [Bifidobacterium bifidum]
DEDANVDNLKLLPVGKELVIPPAVACVFHGFPPQNNHNDIKTIISGVPEGDKPQLKMGLENFPIP